MSASGRMMPWFFAPPIACTRFPCAVPVEYTYCAMSDDPTKLTALMSGCVRIASTETLSPLTTFSTPAGAPASSISSASRIGTEGSFSEGFRMNVLPHAMETAAIQHGIIAGKLNGVMPAQTPRA